MKNENAGIPHPDELKYLQDCLYVVHGKWKLPILYSLSHGHNKFRELHRILSPITSKMLAKELRELAENGFIQKRHADDFSTVHHYEVTEYCKSFERIIAAMINWGKNHREYITHHK